VNVHYRGYNLNMEKNFEQRIAIIFCFRLRKSATEKLYMLNQAISYVLYYLHFDDIVSFHPASATKEIIVSYIEIKNMSIVFFDYRELNLCSPGSTTDIEFYENVLKKI